VKFFPKTPHLFNLLASLSSPLIIMASFTKIEESETPSITIHPSHKIAKINDNIYGGFTE